jgi:hypothetical protein
VPPVGHRLPVEEVDLPALEPVRRVEERGADQAERDQDLSDTVGRSGQLGRQDLHGL